MPSDWYYRGLYTKRERIVEGLRVGGLADSAFMLFPGSSRSKNEVAKAKLYDVIEMVESV